MTAPLTILGIETSCDETAAAVVRRFPDGRGEILGETVLSQLEEHSAYGGVVPEIAARAHVEALDTLVEEALLRSGLALGDVDAIAATSGPGLIGGLIVGLMTGKALALATGKPLYGINHLEGHALTARLTDGLDFPFLMLLVSGGHTQLVLVRGVGDYERWGTTIDDALGEAFDKTAKLIGLPYPGGPAVERAARDGDPERFSLPRPMVGEAQARFFLLRAEDGGAPGGRKCRAADRAGCRRYLRLLPERRGAHAEGPHWPRARPVPRALRFGRAAAGAGRGGGRGGQYGAAHDAVRSLRGQALPLRRAAHPAVHRQRRDDRLGGCRAHGLRSAGRQP